MKKEKTSIQIISTEKGTLIMFFDETAYASFVAGDDSKEVKAFMIKGLDFAKKDMTIILENGVPTKVSVVE